MRANLASASSIKQRGQMGSHRRVVNFACVTTLAGLCYLCSTTYAQDDPQEAATGPDVQWQPGPTVAQIGDIAQIKVPEGYQFTGAVGTQTLLDLMQNPISGDELGLVVPTRDNASWFVVFEFSDVGYVTDDEKDNLDADAILDSIRQGTEQSNALRRERGWATLTIEGWQQPPKYDEHTNNLEWAIRAESEGSPVVNYNTRILGRHGVMEANLVLDPSELSATLPEYKSLLAGYSFGQGQRYGEFRAGDKVAKYGLTALVSGGAAAVAIKTGLFKKFWKLIVVGALAVGALFKKLFGGGKAKTVS